MKQAIEALTPLTVAEVVCAILKAVPQKEWNTVSLLLMMASKEAQRGETPTIFSTQEKEKKER